MKDAALQNLLAKIMINGVLIAAGVMLIGGILYLKRDGSLPVEDHLFRGEPLDLRKPIDIAQAAWKGNILSLIQIGVLLLLANPFIRTFFSILGFGAQKDWLYAGISVIVLAILSFSFFA